MSVSPSIPALKAALPARYKQVGRRAFLRLVAVTSSGSNVSCPCCGRRLRKFARFHGSHEQCPGCGSLMRHRALMLYLRDVLKVGSGDELHVLHVAPERSLQRWLSSLEQVGYVSADLDSPLAAVQADITDLPFAEGSFDLVLCSHVLEHVPDDRSAIHELSRVLRPGGTALIQVPPDEVEETIEDPGVTDPAERERRFDQYDHVRLTGPDYRLRIEAAGFEVASVDYVEQLDAGTRRELCLRTGEPFYLCRKPSP